MKGERGFFFVVVSEGSCFAQAFPLDARSRLHSTVRPRRAAQATRGGLPRHPLPAGEGLRSQRHFSTSAWWARLQPELVSTSLQVPRSTALASGWHPGVHEEECGQQGREVLLPSTLPWGGLIWSPVSNSGLPSSGKMRSYWRESSGGLRG